MNHPTRVMLQAISTSEFATFHEATETTWRGSDYLTGRSTIYERQRVARETLGPLLEQLVCMHWPAGLESPWLPLMELSYNQIDWLQIADALLGQWTQGEYFPAVKDWGKGTEALFESE